MGNLAKASQGGVQALLVLVLVVASCSGQSQQLSDGAVAERMFRATKAQNYDEAIRIGLDALKSKPSDGFLISQVAIVYLQRASSDKKQREKWLELATEYADKTLAAKPGDEWNSFTAGRIYESAGDLATEKKCPYYRRSLEIFDRVAEGTGGPNHGIHDDAASAKLQKAGKEGASRVAQKANAASCMKTGPAARP